MHFKFNSLYNNRQPVRNPVQRFHDDEVERDDKALHEIVQENIKVFLKKLYKAFIFLVAIIITRIAHMDLTMIIHFIATAKVSYNFFIPKRNLRNP